MSPKERYQKDLDDGVIFPDPAQQQAVEFLQKLHEELLHTRLRKNPGIKGWVHGLFSRPAPKRQLGIYFWGGVGRGKTYLMDVFHDSLPFDDKLRTHFHRFMQSLHRDLDVLKGQKDPLKLIAQKIAGETQVICFDEFFVSDIGDAMILAGLLQGLLDCGVVLVATSNIKPDLLYQNGLQRERFIPAINLLNDNMKVVELDGGIDYRLRNLSQAELYHWPLDGDAEAMMHENFKHLAPDFAEAIEAEAVEILGRSIQSRFCGDDVIWFEFEQLCGGPRSAFDYVEIARIYHALLVSGVPQMESSRDDQARRFINLVDELYDRGVKLIISAEVPLQELYNGMTLAAEFQRTLSRLLEMQSHDYLSRPHRPE